MNVRRFLRPHWLLLLPAGISLLVWALPGDLPRGFTFREPFTPFAAVFIGAWYGIVALSAYAGFAAGRSTRPLPFIERTPDRSYYRFFTLVALVGVAYTYWTIIRSNPGLLEWSLSANQANFLRGALPYEAGLHTLRYAAVLSGGVALYMICSRRRLVPIHILNVGLLLAASLIASRLSLVLAAILALALAVHHRPTFTLRPRTLALIAVLGFLVLAPLNYVRNVTYYEYVYGVSDPFLVNLYEITRYLGAPFQASVGVANNATALERDVDVGAAASNFLAPTYLPLSRDPDAIDREYLYRAFVDVDPGLSTNSALASMYGALGPAAFGIAALVAFLAAFVAGHAWSYTSYFFFAAYAVGYAFAEFWRLYLFNAGIIHFLVLTLVALPLLRLAGVRAGAIRFTAPRPGTS